MWTRSVRRSAAGVVDAATTCVVAASLPHHRVATTSSRPPRTSGDPHAHSHSRRRIESIATQILNDVNFVAATASGASQTSAASARRDRVLAPTAATTAWSRSFASTSTSTTSSSSSSSHDEQGASSSRHASGTVTLDRRTFPVTVGATLRVMAPQHWPPLCPVDVVVRTGEEYETIAVEGEFITAATTTAGDDDAAADSAPSAAATLPKITLLADKTTEGDVEVRLTAEHLHPSSSSSLQPAAAAAVDSVAAMTAAEAPIGRGRGSIVCFIPPRFCGVNIVSGGGSIHVDSVVESHVAIDSGGGDVTLGSIRGARLRIATGGGALKATNLTADASISTDGGATNLGKLVGRSVALHTLGGDVTIGALFADDVTIDTAGGDARVKTVQVSGDGRFRTHGGGVFIRGLAGDGEEHTMVDSRGGDVELELHERLNSLHVFTGGGDVALTAPEGFAPKVTVRGVLRGGRRVNGPVLLSDFGGGGGGGGGFGGNLRMVGGTGDEAARKVAAVASSAEVVLDSRCQIEEEEEKKEVGKKKKIGGRGMSTSTTAALLSAMDLREVGTRQAPLGSEDVEEKARNILLDEMFEELRASEEKKAASERPAISATSGNEAIDDDDDDDDDDDFEAGEVNIEVKSWFASVMAAKGFTGVEAGGR